MVAGNDYLIQVKGNQKKFKDAILNEMAQRPPDEKFEETEKNRGRIESRELYLYKDLKGPVFEQWSGLKEVIAMKRSGQRQGKEYENWHYYISSRSDLSAERYAQIIRQHWHIENKVHWVKDVKMNEDKSLVKNTNNASIQSLIRNIVLNIFSQYGEHSITKAIEKYSNRVAECINILLFNKYKFYSSE